MAGKVLIVEDEIINAMALSEVIPGWGCTVVDMVTSGEDAIRVSGVNSGALTCLPGGVHSVAGSILHAD